MPNLGRYCKAFLLRDLRAWVGWDESESAQAATADDRNALRDEDVVFIQDDYRVTRTVFLDERVIQATVTPEWIAFCRDRLGFEVPSWAKDPPVV